MGSLWPYELGPAAPEPGDPCQSQIARAIDIFARGSGWVLAIRMISCQSHDVIAALPTLGSYGGNGAPWQPGDGNPAGNQMRNFPARTIRSVAGGGWERGRY